MMPSDESKDSVPGPIKVKLSPVEETMILTLWSRAHDAAAVNPILDDVHAQKILDRVDPDSFSPTLFPRDRRYYNYITVRAKQLDEWCKTFLEAHAHEPIVPEVVNLRRRLIPDPIRAEGENRVWDYRLIGASVADGGWMDEIPQDRPLLVIAEGLFPYLTPDEAMTLLRSLVKHAPSGQIVMDTVGTILTRYHSFMPLFRGTSVRMKWGVDDGEEVARAHPRLYLAETVLFRDLLPGMFASGAPPCLGVLTPVFSLLPSWRTYGQLLRLEF
ncbi:hypothetical protein NUW58_g5337 [Xylaria curta]|uniref:Uncharacterized protein n=1 Tax=Xylaria curta TaxID=42375 RepID=A0ACC1P3N0_9PEZI|nr:hypothetical protein NUW58_g5337 [Xylaria curta]